MDTIHHGNTKKALTEALRTNRKLRYNSSCIIDSRDETAMFLPTLKRASNTRHKLSRLQNFTTITIIIELFTGKVGTMAEGGNYTFSWDHQVKSYLLFDYDNSFECPTPSSY